MTDSNPQRRFFVALLPPQPIQDYATQIKQDFCDRFSSQAALRSPPHITLQPPFEWPLADIDRVKHQLQAFASNHPPLPIQLSGFGAFPPRVIYIDVVRSPDLLDLQRHLMAHLENTLGIVDPVSKKRPFAPHMTVAFRDLKPAGFRVAWPEFEHRELEFLFTADTLTLLLHNGQRWTIYDNFQLEAEH